MKSFLIAGLFFLAIIGLSPKSASAAVIPFGGQIVTIFNACYQGISVTLSAPTPGVYLFTPSSQPYPFGPPSHVGQWLLGLAGPYLVCTIPCHAGACPDPAHSGLTIIFSGSSQ